ncbi:MAG TPA: hypothetical protein VJV79_03435 [Polyangiaceae bacterium]|nr:hypothetical protein [Polyangiaceae bacterium]
MRKSFLTWLTVMLGMVACGHERGQEPVAVERAALALSVSRVLDVEAMPPLQASGGSQQAKMACGTQRCFVAYAQVFQHSQFMFGSRVSASGAVLDLPRIELGPGGSEALAVSARGDQFFVAWRAKDSGSFRYHITLVDGASGKVTDLSSKVPVGVHLRDLQVTANRALIGYVDAGTYKVALFDSSFAPIGVPAVLAAPSSAQLSPAVPGSGQFLIAWDGGAQRVNADDGTLLDATPIQFSRYKRGQTWAAFVNGNYQLVWATDANLYGSRIRASDGMVLDPDDTFNQLTGAKLLCASCSETLMNVRVNALGSDALVTWTSVNVSGPRILLLAARVSSTTGQRVDGETSSAELSLADGSQTELWLSGTSGLILTDNLMRSVSITPSPLAFQFGATSAVAVESTPRTAPRSASNGSSFLAVWVADGKVRGTLIDPSSGAFANTPPLDFGSGHLPAVTAVGSDYLVAWLTPATLQMQRRVVRANGTLDGLLSDSVSAKYANEAQRPNAKELRLTYNGKYVLASWLYSDQDTRMQLRVIRLTSSGTGVEAEPVRIADLRYEPYAVLADSAPPEAMRTFLLVDSESPFSADLTARRLRSELGTLLPETTIVGQGFYPFAASNAGQLALAYQATEQRQVAQFVDLIAGTPIGSAVTLLPAVPLSSHFWWDGVSFVTLTADGNTLFGRRFDASFAPLDAAIAGDGSALATVNALPLDSSVSADGHGNSLLLFQDESITHYGYAIHGVLVRNDGLTTPVGSAGSGGTNGNGGTGSGGSTSPAGVSGAPTESAAGASGQSDSETNGGSANASGASAQAGSDVHGGHSNNAGSAAIGASNDDGGSSATAGASPSSDKKDDQSGCACRVAGSRRSSRSAFATLALLGFALARRGRSRRID